VSGVSGAAGVFALGGAAAASTDAAGSFAVASFSVATLAVPLGHRVAASLALGATALVARQTSGGGASLGVQPLVSATAGVGYAF
jgi:hypothetical protein